MYTRSRFTVWVILLLGMAVRPASVALAADAPPVDESDRSIREQSIYIPYEKLREVFEQHGRGVFLPYEKFQELWQAAQDKTRPVAEPKPPVGALITETDNEATVERDVVRVKAKVHIEVLAEGWHEVSLRLSDAAITAASIAGKPARIIGSPGQDYRLLIEKLGKQPEELELSLEYAKAIVRSPGQNSVAFQSPQAPVSRWRVTIPQPGVKVQLQPLLAATEVPNNVKNDRESADAAQTVVLAFVGTAETVRIDWTPKAEGAAGLDAVASVQSQQQVWIAEGVMRTRVFMAYSISRAELDHLTIDVPADQKVVNLFDPNVRQWSVEAVEGRQRINVQLFEPAKSAQQVTIELEKLTGEQSRMALELPAVAAVGGQQQIRQQGTLVVHLAEGFRAEVVAAAGLLQIDAGELPPALKRSQWAFAYRFASADYRLTLNVEQLQPRIVADSLVEAYVEPERLALDVATIYTIENTGVFRLELNVPAGYDVRQVRGAELAGAAAVQVESHHLQGDDKTRLVVNLSRKAIGRVGLTVQLEQELQRPELLTPTGKGLPLSLPVPVVAPETVERATGRLVVYAPDSLRLNPAKLSGLRGVSFQEALQGVQSVRQSKPEGLRQVLAFAFAQEPPELTLTAECRKPQITVRQLLVVRVEEGVVKYQATFFYKVLYSGVKSLRLDVPTAVVDGLRVVTPGVRDEPITPAPDDLPENHVAWRLVGESELLGDGKFELTWEKKLDRLAVGKSVRLPVPYLKPREVDRTWGQIVLVKSETIDLQESDEPAALRPIDPQHDLATPVPQAARAFEFHEDWALTIAATRYQLEELKRTSIERAVARMVVTPADTIAVQVLYRMKSAQQRLAVRLPEGVSFDTQPLRIDGRSVPLEKGRQNEYSVPLTATNADEPFLLELRYSLPGDGHMLELPQFLQEPAVVKAYLCVYLPETRTLLGVRGPWTRETNNSVFASIQSNRDGDNRLVDWVVQGVSHTGDSVRDFPTDGRLYVFSTLSPAPPPEGALRLTSIDSRLLSGLVFFVTLLLGVVLAPTRLSLRTIAVAAAIIAVVLAGVFLPTFSSAVLGVELAWAVFLVAVIWIAAAIARRRCCKTASIGPSSQPQTMEGGPNNA